MGAAARFAHWAVGTEGSSRSAALIRIGLVFLIWTRFAHDQLPFRHELGWQTAFSIAFYLASFAMLVGYRTRLATAVTGVLTMSFYFLHGLVLDYEPYRHHHTYWLGIAPLLLALAPCGRSFSLDRWLALRAEENGGPSAPPERGNLWGLRLIVIQLTMMYFWSAVDKCHAGFLSGERLEALFVYFYIGSDLDAWSHWLWVFPVMAWAVVLLEFALAFGMPFAAPRKYLVIPGILLHAAFYVVLPVFTYSATVILLYLAYFDADKVHRIVDRLVGHNAKEGETC